VLFKTALSQVRQAAFLFGLPEGREKLRSSRRVFDFLIDFYFYI